MSNISQEKKIKSQEEDLLLLKDIRDGNQLAYKQLQNKYSKIISTLIRKMIKDEDDVEDLTQEAFIKAFGNLDKYNETFNFSSWFFRIASNHCIDFLRKKRFQTISIDQPINDDEDDQYFDIKDDTYQPETTILDKERKELLYQTIDELPDNYKLIIKLRHEEDLDYKEISDKLDLPLGTVKAHLFRARKILLEKLKTHSDIF